MKSRNGLIDLYRLIYAETIVCHHAKYLQGRNDGNYLLPGAYSAVEFFFILSGLFLAKSASQSGEYDLNTLGQETWNVIKK